MKKIYFDYASTTPIDPKVLKAITPYFSGKFGNPGSLHSFGQEAIAAVDLSREKIARTIGADFREIIFTGSATESNNIALRGITQTIRRKTQNFREGQREVSNGLRPRLIVSAIEHESILETAKDLAASFQEASLVPSRFVSDKSERVGWENQGVEVIYLPVDKKGFVDLKKLKESLNERTILVSVMYANNEIGTIQPISKISEIIGNFRGENLENRKQKVEKLNSRFYFLDSKFPLLHVDAVQAFQYLDCNVNELGIDLMTLSAHKIYGPKGIGMLYIRKQKSLDLKSYVLNPIITGGGQEFGLRSGTENVSSIVGFAKAVELAENSREFERKRIGDLRDYFWHELKKIYPHAQINADSSAKISERIFGGQTQINAEKYLRKSALNQRSSATLPNILNIYFPNHKAEDLLIKLDIAGIAVSAGSACRTRSTKPSHVLESLGMPIERIKNSLRFSFGRFTTEKEIAEAIKRMNRIFKPLIPHISSYVED